MRDSGPGVLIRIRLRESLVHPRLRFSSALLLLLSACSDSTGPGGKIGAGTLRLIPGIDTLAAGESVQFSARLVPDTGGLLSPGEVIWSSSNPDVASVSKGMVTGHRSGSAEIVAVMQGDRATATIAVERRFKATSVAVGPGHTCALAPDGQAWCVGIDADGKLGLGTFGGSQTSMTAPVVGGITFRAIAVNDRSSCGLAADGRAWCWGSNSLRLLGHAPAFQNSAVPVVADTLRTYDSLASGGLATCGLSAGSAWCWGQFHGSPKAVSVGGTPAAITVTTSLQCAALSSTGLSCWRAIGFSGGGGGPASGPYRSVAAGRSVTDATTGSYLCAIGSDAQAWCWGSNPRGQLGDGSTANRGTAMPVNGGRVFTALSAGTNFACGTDPAGVLRCWGANEHGQLAAGDSTDALEPRLALTQERFTSVSAGADRACAVSTAQELWCWGAGIGPAPAPVVY